MIKAYIIDFCNKKKYIRKNNLFESGNFVAVRTHNTVILMRSLTQMQSDYLRVIAS